jgi:hypothetical protein
MMSYNVHYEAICSARIKDMLRIKKMHDQYF